MKSGLSSYHILIANVLALALLFSFEGRIAAQAGLSLSPAAALRVNVDMVSLSFSVRDKSRRFVRDLTKEDVVLLEDEVSQDIAFFDAENVPLSLVVLVDVSESTEPYSKEIKAVSRAIADLLHSEDEAAVIAFSDVPVLLGDASRILPAARQAHKRRIMPALSTRSSRALRSCPCFQARAARRRATPSRCRTAPTCRSRIGPRTP
jgi:hypothetical protein